MGYSGRGYTGVSVLGPVFGRNTLVLKQIRPSGIASDRENNRRILAIYLLTAGGTGLYRDWMAYE